MRRFEKMITKDTNPSEGKKMRGLKESVSKTSEQPDNWIATSPRVLRTPPVRWTLGAAHVVRSMKPRFPAASHRGICIMYVP